MTDISIFNDLSTLSDGNEVLKGRLEALGDRSDLRELKDIFERYETTRRVGLSLLHRHFLIEEGERVVEFGHVSTPWPVPANGKVAGGYVVPRSWRFMNSELKPYEYGFNIAGQEDYDNTPLPSDFVGDVGKFLVDNNLDDVLGICAIGPADLEGRIELNRGRVNFTIPAVTRDNMDQRKRPEHAPSVWTFDCKDVMTGSFIQLARACWVCPKH